MGPPPTLQGSQVDGRFHLLDVKGGDWVTQDTYDGQWRLVFFGFTSCHVVCPTGLALMDGIVDELAADGVDIVPIFITVDPARDTPEKMAKYLAHFDERIVGLGGPAADVEAAMRSFRIEAPKMEVRSETEYQLDHPALMMLMDPSGKYVKHIPSAGDAKEQAQALREAMAAHSP